MNQRPPVTFPEQKRQTGAYHPCVFVVRGSWDSRRNKAGQDTGYWIHTGSGERPTDKRPEGLFTAALALFTELDILLNLVSIGTLFVFYMVANAVVYRRYVATGSTADDRHAWPTVAFILAFSMISLSFTLLWQFAPHGGVKIGLLVACAVGAVATVGAFQALVPQAHKPELWGVPGMPWVPAASVFLNVFLLGSLDRPSYIRFGFFSAAAVLVYVLYSVHASYDAEESGALDAAKVQDQSCKV